MSHEENLADEVLGALESLDPEVRGTITVVRSPEGYLEVVGDLFPSPRSAHSDPNQLVKAALELACPGEPVGAFPFRSRPTSRRMSVASEVDGSVAATDEYKRRNKLYTEDPSEPPRRDRHVDVLYLGPVSIDRIHKNGEYKKENWQTRDKVGNCIVELGFFAPVVLDRHYRIIDGDQRVSLAQELGAGEILAVVLDIEGVKADFLRLALNRSTEFQKWKHPELDPFINGHPELQPLLEPLGFFGERILPVSFFGDTIISYKLDEYHYQQSAYKQEEGLAKWAEIQRDRMKAMEEQRTAKRKKPKPADKPLTDGLFG